MIGSVVYGEGIASYMNDGGVDMAPTAIAPAPAGALPQIVPTSVPLVGVMAYYEHNWSSRWSSSMG